MPSSRGYKVVRPGSQSAGNGIARSIPSHRAISADCRRLRDVARVDMCCTCNYVERMSVMIQIRNVPDALHRRLKSRAALAGMSLSDYLLSEIRHVAERPTLDELRARLEHRP